jgi:hypothetical protein
MRPEGTTQLRRHGVALAAQVVTRSWRILNEMVRFTPLQHHAAHMKAAQMSRSRRHASK